MTEDVGAEAAVIAGCAQNSDSFLDVDCILQSNTFTDEINQVIWKLIKNIREEKLDRAIDFSLLQMKAKELGYSHVFDNIDNTSYIKKLLRKSVEPSNVRLFAARIRKFEIGRLLVDQLDYAKEELLNLRGNESYASIVGLVENRIFDFSSLLNNEDSGPKHISEGLDEYYEYLLNTDPTDIVGIPSGFPVWDSILGGQRRRSVSVVAARTGIGKSIFGDNVALHVTGLNIPILYLDTEMELDQHWHRLLGNMAKITITDIENRRFKLNELNKDKVKRVKDYLNTLPYTYWNISGKPFEDTLSYIRRWVLKNVGYDENGRVKDCLVIYDYLKMMTGTSLTDNMKEYQIMGFQMTGLHNFAIKFDLPILTFVQLNRDGIDKESTDTISQSDRIGWLASNVSIYKPKTDTEMASSYEEGNRKMVVIKNRFGPVNAPREYINMKFIGKIARIKEGRLSSDVSEPTGETRQVRQI